MKENLFICGDVHGELVSLVGTKIHQIKNSDIVCVGDLGVGFGGPNSTKVMYERLEPKLEKFDINIYSIRGNHDNPEFFDGEHNFDRLKFLEDHKTYNIQGKSFYTIGGATSPDIDFPDNKNKTRRQLNEDLIRRGSRKRVWWPEEVLERKLTNLPKKVDYIISHEAPVSFLPVPIRGDFVNYETWENIIGDRKYLQDLTTLINSSWWFYGHYHQSFLGHYGNLMYRGLKINELVKIE